MTAIPTEPAAPITPDAPAAPTVPHAHAAHAAHGAPASDGMVRIALNLGAAGLIAGVLLATLNAYTAPIREQNEVRAREEARRAVLPAATRFVPIDGHEGWFSGYAGDGRPAGYVIAVKEKGYSGAIELLVGVDDGLRIVDYRVLRHNETPGLGAKATEVEFRQRFRGRSLGQLGVAKVAKLGEIQAITGATITSRAVARGIERELKALHATLPGGRR